MPGCQFWSQYKFQEDNFVLKWNMMCLVDQLISVLDVLISWASSGKISRCKAASEGRVGPKNIKSRNASHHAVCGDLTELSRSRSLSSAAVEQKTHLNFPSLNLSMCKQRPETQMINLSQNQTDHQNTIVRHEDWVPRGLYSNPALVWGQSDQLWPFYILLSQVVQSKGNIHFPVATDLNHSVKGF